MPGCSNCGREVEDKSKICPHCGRPTRLNSPGIMASGTFGCLVAAVFICGVIGAIIYPVFASAKTAANRTLALSQCKRIAIAVDSYLTDNNDRLPPMKSSVAVAGLIEKYLAKPDELKTMECATKGTWNTVVAGLSVNAIDNPSEVWLFYTERESDPGFGAIAFLDTHSRFANKYVFDGAMAKKPIIDESAAPKASKKE